MENNNIDYNNTIDAVVEESEVTFDSRKIFKSKIKMILLFGLGGLIVLGLIVGSIKGKKGKVIQQENNKQVMDLDAGSKATDTDRMWRQNLEDKQSNLDKTLQSRLEDIKTDISQKAIASDNKKTQEITHLKEKLNFIQAELDVKKQESSNLQINQSIEKTPRITRHVINLNNNKNNKEYIPLKTADNYIPAGTMIQAATLNGLRASTSLQSMSNPDEILIQLIDYGILPNNFRNNLKDCVIVADAYGDLSSETVKIRTSKLSCIEVETGESVETDLVGMVVGGDGYAGVKGTIVSIDQKYLANASIFGIMSGLAGIGVKDSTAYNPFTIGSGTTEAMSEKEQAKSKLLQGTSSSLDKLSDYYIAHAEKIQPVIEIDRGRSVTIAVLKGSYIGTSALKTAKSKKQDSSIKRKADGMEDNLIDSMNINRN